MEHAELEQMGRVKDLLHKWAAWAIDRQRSYPTQSAFVTERVDSMNRDTDSLYSNAPEDVVMVDKEINRLHPRFVAILNLQYKDKRPQKTKAAVLGISRTVFSQRVLWIHEHLTFIFFGGEVFKQFNSGNSVQQKVP